MNKVCCEGWDGLSRKQSIFVRKKIAASVLLLVSMFLSLNVSAQTLISISNPPAAVNTTTAGATQFWPNAGTVNGTPVSLRATVDSINGSIRLFTSGDNPVVRTNTGGSMATITWEITNAATGAPILADPNFLITDIDGSNGNPNESVSAACAGLTSFTVNGSFLAGCNANNNSACETNIRVTESGGNILAEGTQNQNGGQQEGYMQYSWTGVDNWVVSYMSVTGGRWFVHDADGDVPFDGTEIAVNLVDMATIKGITAGSLTAPAQGEQITFQIDMSNAGPQPATGANLTDLLPAGLVYVSDTTTSGTYNPATGVWSGVNVAVNGIETLTITATVTAAAGTTITNTTTTALATESICSSRDLLEFSFVVAETPAPSLSIVKSIDPVTSFDAAGDTITYRYEVTNTGNVNINGVVPVDSGPTFGGQPATVTSPLVFNPASATITPGQVQIFTATYVLDQADVDNMAADPNPLTAIDNTASATGVPTAGTLATVTPSTVETGFAPTPSLTVVKAVSSATTFSEVGDVITYQYTVTNTGNIAIDGASPTDSGPTFNGSAAAGVLTAFSPVSADLAPGDNQVFTATYTLQQADIDNMAAAADPLTAIDNTASATGDPIGATALPPVPDSTAETGFAPDPSMTVTKSVSTATVFSQEGDTITYQYELLNTGNVTINNAVPTDSGPTFNGVAATNSLSSFSPSSVTLVPGAAPIIVTATYILAQQDIDNMFAASDPTTAIDNTASATGAPTGGALPTVPDSTAETGFVVTASLALTKSAGTPSIGLGTISTATDAGDTITYSFDVINDGDVSIDAISINDLGTTFNGAPGTGTLSTISCPLTALAPNQTTTCSATYTLSQADVDNAIIGGLNAVENTATAVGEDPADNPVTSPSDTANQTIASDSSIDIVKSASAPTIVNGADATLVDPGDVISYQLDVDNTGNTTLSGVQLSDSIATVTCPSTTDLGNAFANDGTAQLVVGDGIACTAVYTLLQTDLDAGGVQNTAEVASTDPTGATVNDTDVVNSGFTQTTSLGLIKAATPLSASPVDGEPITYTFTLTNTGNVSLTSPQVTDPICETPAGPLTLTNGFQGVDTGVAGELEAGETWVFECVYTIDLADVNAGEVANTATATGTPPPSSGLPDPSSTASNLADAQQNAAIALDKSSSLPTVANGGLPAATDVGDTVNYTFEVENTGNVTLTNVVVTDPLITGAPNNGSITCPAGIASMAPNDVLSCTATYTLTQADIDAGMVANTASVVGAPPPSVPPLDNPVANSANMVTVAPMPDLEVDKSVAPLTAPLLAGSDITYTFIIQNTGNVTINNVVPVDSGPTFNGSAATNTLSAFNPVSADLAPGTSESFTAIYTLDQADIDNISAALDPLTAIDNSATATGDPENGTLPTIDPDTTETGALPNPSVNLVKSSVAPPPLITEGDDITYTFLLNNDGNVTIFNPVINDAGCSVPGTVLSFSSGFVPGGDTGATVGALDVGETWTFSCTYAVSQADINAGTVANTATGGGQDPSGGTVNDDAQEDTALAQTSSFTVVKSTASIPSVAGDTLLYEFVVDNTGNVDISSVNVIDVKCSAAPVLVGGDVDGNLILSPSEIWMFECVSIPVTQTEVDNGAVDNEVDVTGVAPPTAPLLPVAEDDVSTPISPAPALSVEKSSVAPTTGLGSISSDTDAGDTIVYSFDVENTGNVTITSLSINDPGPTFGGNVGTGVFSGVSCPLSTLLPSQTTTCSATYTLSQGDIDAAIAAGPNSVENEAQAQGQDPDSGSVTSPTDEDTTSIESSPEVLILKTSGAPTVLNGIDSTLTDPGDTVDFEITVENTGNTTLSAVTIADLLAPVSCAATTSLSNSFVNGGVLVVGDSVICTAEYTIQQTDINSGQVVNTATVSSTDPAGEPVDDIAEATTPFTQKTSIVLIKTASVLPVTPAPLPGDLITYTFTLENTGNVSLSAPQVDDPQCQIPVGPLVNGNGLDLTTDLNSDGLLDAGEVWIFNCDYAVTAADLDTTGEVTNTATGSGTPPIDSGLDAPSSTSSAVVKAEQSTAITLDKVAGIPTTAAGALSGVADVGDTVTFAFNIENQGNVTFNTVSLIDPLITGAPNNGAFTCVLNDVATTSFTLDSDPLPALPAVNSISCTAEYTLTQQDVDAGTVANTATALGNPPGPVPPPPEATSGSTVPIPAEPSMTIAKSASPIPTDVAAGSVITYTYVVTNTGNVTIDNAAPIDLGPTFNGVSGTNVLRLPPPDDVAEVIDIAPGNSSTFTATYVISQQDLDNMAAAADPTVAIDNSATADGEPVNGVLPPVPPSTVETGVDASPALELIKTSSVVAPVAAGSIVTYTFMLSNTGNVTVTNPIVTDAMCQSPASPLSFTNGFIAGGDTGANIGALDVGETWEFSCGYALTQANLDAGTVQNTANGSGQDPAGNPVDDDSDSGNIGDGGTGGADPTNTPLPRTPNWLIDKSTTSVPTAAGQTLDYTFVLTNTGNTTISGVTVADAKCVGGFANLDTATDVGSDNVLTPAGAFGVPLAESWTYTCTSIPVTQAEMDAGLVINEVVASGTAPGGGLADAPDREETTVIQTPSMSLVKSAGAATLNNDGSFDQVFNFELKNLGNITLTAVTITDNIPAQFGACYIGVAQPGVVSVNDAAPTADTLNATIGAAPVVAMADSVGVGDSVIVTGFSVTLDPNAAGCAFPDPAQNSAVGGSNQVSDESDDGTDPDAAAPDGPGTPTTFIPPVANPEVGLAKSARLLSLNDDFSFDVEFTIMMQNTGDVNLSNLQMFDDLVTQFGAAYVPSAANDATGGVIVAPVVSAVTDAGLPNLQLPVVDPLFDGGAGNIFDGISGGLGVGDVIQVVFTVRANPTLLPSLPVDFRNIADGAATAPDGSVVSDQSNSGNDPEDGSGGGVEATIIALEDIAALPIVLGQFSSTIVGETIVIEWQTQTEVGNLGFNLYGKFGDEWRRLNEDVIPGQGDSVEIIDYSFTAQSGAVALAISDVDARGEEELHGPFIVGNTYGAQTQRKTTDWSDAIKRSQTKQQSRDAKRRAQMLERNRKRQQRNHERQQRALKLGS